MWINQVQLSELDPLRLFTHETLFHDEHEKEEEEESEEEEKRRPDDEKLVIIWNSMTKSNSKNSFKKVAGHFRFGPHLRDLARLLNRSDVQNLIQDYLKNENHPDPIQREKSRRIKENLGRLNQKIDQANQVWYRKVPLLSRVFWQIDRIRIPSTKK